MVPSGREAKKIDGCFVVTVVIECVSVGIVIVRTRTERCGGVVSEEKRDEREERD